MAKVGTVNASILRKEGLTDNMLYRNYLQANGDSTRSYNMSIAMSETSARIPNTTFGYVVGPPHLYVKANSPQAPKYQSSDLKEWYFNTGRL